MKLTSRTLAGVCAAGVAACLIACGVPVPPTATKYSSPENTRPAVAKTALPGGDFNKYFPKDEEPYTRIYTTEKQGTAQATWNKDGKKQATLTIFDTVSESDVAAEYKAKSTEKVEGYPYLAQGKQGSKILVADRFQVQVQSDPPNTLDEAARKDVFKRFDLAGLAQLNK